MSHHSSAVLQGRHSGLLAAEVVVGAHVLSGGRGCPLLCVLPAHSQRATDRLRHEIWILIPFPDQEVDPLSASRCQVTVPPGERLPLVLLFYPLRPQV